MSIVLPFLLVLLVVAIAAYHRFSLAVFAGLAGAVLVACALGGANVTAIIVRAVLLALVVLPLLITPLRQPPDHRAAAAASTRRSCRHCRTTEQTALEAGTVGFEGELFSGMPKWERAAVAAQARC